MYTCSKCNKGVILLNGEIFRACAAECVNEPVTASVSMSMKGVGGLQ